jgi:hypothetical protein
VPDLALGLGQQSPDLDGPGDGVLSRRHARGVFGVDLIGQSLEDDWLPGKGLLARFVEDRIHWPAFGERLREGPGG